MGHLGRVWAWRAGLGPDVGWAEPATWHRGRAPCVHLNLGLGLAYGGGPWWTGFSWSIDHRPRPRWTTSVHPSSLFGLCGPGAWLLPPFFSPLASPWRGSRRRRVCARGAVVLRGPDWQAQQHLGVKASSLACFTVTVALPAWLATVAAILRRRRTVILGLRALQGSISGLERRLMVWGTYSTYRQRPILTAKSAVFPAAMAEPRRLSALVAGAVGWCSSSSTYSAQLDTAWRCSTAHPHSARRLELVEVGAARRARWNAATVSDLGSRSF